MSFVSSMSSFMNYQMLSLHKQFVTVGTLIILYPSVNSHMIFMDTMKSKGLTTLFTLKVDDGSWKGMFIYELGGSVCLPIVKS